MGINNLRKKNQDFELSSNEGDFSYRFQVEQKLDKEIHHQNMKM